MELQTRMYHPKVAKPTKHISNVALYISYVSSNPENNNSFIKIKCTQITNRLTDKISYRLDVHS